ncbi:MAG: hypothetical protein ACXWLM_12285, partial [Myxococcales bacterium]
GQGPLVMNEAAYALAEANAAIERAFEWAHSAILAETAQLEAAQERAGESEVVQTQSLLAAWDTMGWILFRQGKLDEAERYVAGAERLRESAEVSDHLGQILERQGRRDEAIRAYARALASPFPFFETRARLAALAGEAAVGDAVRRGRAEVESLHSVTVAPAPAAVDPEMDLLLVFARDGSIAAARPAIGETLPAGANRLIGARIEAAFPAGAPRALVARARFSCVAAASCKADFGRSRTAPSP